MPPAKKSNRQERSALSSAFTDGVVTALFVFVSSQFDEVAAILAPYMPYLPELAVGIAVLIAGLALFDPVSSWVGGHGALYNPVHNVAFAAAGRGPLSKHISRMVGQAIGGVVGAAAALRAIPPAWQSKFPNFGKGLRPGVSLGSGMACEATLGFLLNLCVLWSIGQKNKYIAFWSPLVATIFLVVAGANLTGPSMNPVVSFSWFFHLRGHALLEHLLVFWVAPLAGALAAGLVWWAAMRPATRRRASRARKPSAPKKTQKAAAASKKTD
ncbi:hypothetical protein WJX72_007660 [[Myrmecia] bisecta]|uniref:Uncharacterized protein n=1 Tax=[Myrmecia] bisecta TaxID=41462 RepID=A0AAW1PQI4_9CHLO